MVANVTVPELARLLGGRVVGARRREPVSGTCPVDRYVPGKVAYVKNTKYGEMLTSLTGAVVLLPASLAELAERHPQNTYILVDDVLVAMMDLQERFHGDLAQPGAGIAPNASVDRSARLGKDVFIGEHAWVGKNVRIGDEAKVFPNCCILDDVAIGDRTLLYPGVTIYPGSRIGRGCIIHAGVCIGADGFRFEQDPQRKAVRKWHHAGAVVIGDRVEIGANSTIDRATFADDATVLEDDVKLDDQVHIGHNARIGARTLIAAQTCVSGSVKMGEDIWVGAGATVSNGVSIGNRARILLNAVVAYDVGEDEVVSGFYAMPHRQWKRAYQKLKESGQG